MKQSLYKSILFYLSTTLVGLVFIISGFFKAIDPLGTVYKIQDYWSVMHLNMLNDLAPVVTFVLFTIEFITGVMLLLNINFRVGLWICSMIMCCMTPFTLWIAATDPVSNCGCFGDAIIISNWATFIKNIILDVFIVIMWIFRKSYKPWLSPFPAWATTITFILLINGFGIHAINNLPLIDFRPYKIGNNIIEGMQLPEGAKHDIYNTTFIYSKNGVNQEFQLQDAPYNDSTWTFVEQRTELIEKGDEAPIHDFSITTIDGLDITNDILYSENRTYLVVMYDLNKTNIKTLDNINKLYNQANSEGAGFLALTASADLIDDFKRQYHLKYDFALTDPIQLKTMVRANPGVVVLDGAVIVDKFNPNWRCKSIK